MARKAFGLRRTGLGPFLGVVVAFLLGGAAARGDEPSPGAEAKPPEEKPAEAAPAAKPPAPPADEGDPNGAAGPSSIESVKPQPGMEKDFLPYEDRWRIKFPEWSRYPGQPGENTGTRSDGILDPYDQNVLKGDYPIIGNEIFMVLTLQSDTLVEGRSFPLPAGISTNRPRNEQFFGEFHSFLANQNFITSVELFKGDAAFKPKDIVLKILPVFNVNYVKFFENNVTRIDVRDRDNRTDYHIGLQELLFEYHLVNISPEYDFITTILGIQPFTSDFRGFLYSDNNLGARLQANYASNRLQWNLAYFSQLEKDTNSGLNEYRLRGGVGQHVFIANFFCQDFLSELSNAFFGYTFLLNYHYNLDESDVEYDTNGFLVRPAKIGNVASDNGRIREKKVRVHYLGFGGDGHIGPLNLTHQYYFAVGSETNNEITGKKQNVLAHFFATELSVDVDWLRFKGSFLYSSGDRNPNNDTATGFDTILDNPFFAGSGFSYFNRQNIPLVQTGVQLKQRLSLVPNLRSSKTQGQSNFVNPGLFLYNLGAAARITPKLFVDANVNFLYFDSTEVLEKVLVQSRISKFFGIDYSVGFQYRPLLIDNIIITAGAAALMPGQGFKNLYNKETVYSGFLSLTLTY